MERDPAGAGTVLWTLRGELLGMPFTPAQNKAALCQKLAFPQSHGRPRSPDLTPLLPQTQESGAPTPSSPRTQGPWSASLCFPRIQESGLQHPDPRGVRCPVLASLPPPLPLGEASESPTPLACQVG